MQNMPRSFASASLAACFMEMHVKPQIVGHALWGCFVWSVRSLPSRSKTEQVQHTYSPPASAWPCPRTSRCSPIALARELLAQGMALPGVGNEPMDSLKGSHRLYSGHSLLPFKVPKSGKESSSTLLHFMLRRSHAVTFLAGAQVGAGGNPPS